MQVFVQYQAQLRRAAGRAEEAVEVEADCSVGRLLGVLAAEHSETFRALVLDPQAGPRPSLLIFVGAEQARVEQTLCAGDKVTLLTPMAGG